MAEQTSSDEEQQANKSEDLKARNAIPYLVSLLFALKKKSYFCLSGGLAKEKCQQSTSTSCSTMQELQGQCRATYGCVLLGQKETVGQGEEPELDRKKGQACVMPQTLNMHLVFSMPISVSRLPFKASYGARRACRCGSKARASAVAECGISLPEEEEA